MTKQNWQAIYSAGEQLNRYPYDFIVSNFFRHRPTRDDGSPARVLDLGCGAGNHALFCAENGAEVLACDYSSSALDVVSQRAEARGLSDRVRTMQIDFEDFDLDEDGFDIMIDRLAVSHVSRQFATRIYDRVYELLAPDGIVLANLFSTGHSHKDFGTYDEGDDIWREFDGGIFEDLKTAYFYNEEGIRHLCRRFTFLSLVRRTDDSLIGEPGQRETWEIVAQR